MPKPKHGARVLTVAGVTFLHQGDGLMIIEPARIDGPLEGGVAYKPEKVICTYREGDIRELRDFFNDACEVFDQHHEYQKKLHEAKKKCVQCPRPRSDSFPMPNEKDCVYCENLAVATEAFEQEFEQYQ
ncbi:MAG: hypothetical protein MJA84_04625 [Firmicutes bacterium]|nr:hypothetical protein [Bacillota bacterium]